MVERSDTTGVGPLKIRIPAGMPAKNANAVLMLKSAPFPFQGKTSWEAPTSKVMQLGGAKTNKEAVNQALMEFFQNREQMKILVNTDEQSRPPKPKFPMTLI